MGNSLGTEATGSEDGETEGDSTTVPSPPSSSSSSSSSSLSSRSRDLELLYAGTPTNSYRGPVFKLNGLEGGVPWPFQAAGVDVAETLASVEFKRFLYQNLSRSDHLLRTIMDNCTDESVFGSIFFFRRNRKELRDEMAQFMEDQRGSREAGKRADVQNLVAYSAMEVNITIIHYNSIQKLSLLQYASLSELCLLLSK